MDEMTKNLPLKRRQELADSVRQQLLSELELSENGLSEEIQQKLDAIDEMYGL